MTKTYFLILYPYTSHGAQTASYVDAGYVAGE